MKKTKLIFIGSYAKGTVAVGGELAKNQQFIKRFNEIFDKVYAVDTNKWYKRPWVLIQMLWHLIFHGHDTRVVLSCHRMAYPIIVMLYFFRLKKHVIFWVIGSEIVRRLDYPKNDENSKMPREFRTLYKVKYFKYLDKIIVQSPKMVHDLEKAGLKNAVYVPNSKHFYEIEKRDNQDVVTKFVFLSRISPEKGCDYILNCIDRLNAMGLSDKIRVVFYGKPEVGYTQFYERVNLLDNVEYKGSLDLTNRNGYEQLAENDVFIFPTFFPNEGFPGALIDAMIAGLPVIASDWNYNNEVVVEGETGIMIPAHNENALYNEMLAFIENKYDIRQMRKACMREAHKYDVNEVLSKERLSELGVYVQI